MTSPSKARCRFVITSPLLSQNLPRSYLQNTSGIPAWAPLVLKLIEIGKYAHATYFAVEKYSFSRTVVEAQCPCVYNLASDSFLKTFLFLPFPVV